MKKNILPVLMTASLISLAMLPLRAPGAEVAMLFKQDLADMAGKAGQVLTVEFARVKSPPRIATTPILSFTYWKVPW